MARIAVIDDDSDFLQLMRDVLSVRRWEILPCRDSLTAFEVLRDEDPDVVVLDIRMETQQSGWDILTFLNLHPETNQIPVVVCSASALEVEEKASWLREHGATVLHKPFDIDDMYEALDRAIERRRKTSDAQQSSAS